MAAPRLAAAGRIAPHDQGPAAVAEIAGIAGVFRNLPQAGQANAVRMHQAAEAFSIRAPKEVSPLRPRDAGAGTAFRQAGGNPSLRRTGELLSKGIGGTPGPENRTERSI